MPCKSLNGSYLKDNDRPVPSVVSNLELSKY